MSFTLDGTLNSDVARRALLKCTSAIVESAIEPVTLARRLVEEEVISEDVYKIVKDKKTGSYWCRTTWPDSWWCKGSY